MSINVFMQDNRDSLEKSLSTKCGQEPFILLLLNEDKTVNTLFLIGDGVKVCKNDSLEYAILLLCATYYLVNLNYPKEFCQILGLIQMKCLQLEFPAKLRNTQFDLLKDLL